MLNKLKNKKSTFIDAAPCDLSALIFAITADSIAANGLAVFDTTTGWRTRFL